MNRLFLFICLSAVSFKLHSQNYDQLKAKADSHYLKRDYKACIVILDKLLAKDPTNTELLYYKSYTCFNNQQYQQSVDICNKLMASKPSEDLKVKLFQLRGTSYYALDKNDQALKDYLDFLITNENSSILLNTAYIYYDKKDFEKCIYYSNKVFGAKDSDDKDMTKAYEYLGESYYKLDKPDTVKAMESLKKAIRIDPNNLFARFYLGFIYLNKGENERSLDYSTQALQIDTANHFALYNRACAYYNLKEYDKCLKDLYKFKRLGGVEDEYYSTLGDTYRKLDKQDSAIDNYHIYLKDNPRSAYYYNELAWQYYLSKDYTNAVKYADKAIDIDKKDDDSYDTRGCALYKLKEYSKAIKDFNKALDIEPNYNNSMYYRGMCYLYLNKKTEACKDWQTLLTTDYKVKEGELEVKELIKTNCN